MKKLPERLLHLAALAFVVHLALVPMAETDLFFHLKIGDLIRARHAIPFRNLFSFTFPGEFDPDLAWLFQVTVSLAYSIGKFPAIVLLKTALITVAAALTHRACRRGGAGPIASAIAIVGMALAAEQRMVERPHIVTFVGIGALNLILAEVERGRRKLLWVIPAIAVVWANFHAGVFFAPLVLILWWLGKAVDERRIDWRAARVIPVTLVAIFLSPAGARLPKYLLWHTGLGSTRNIEEFRVAEVWSDPWFFLFIGGCGIALLALRRQIQVRRILPILAVCVLAWRSVRFVAEWAFLAAPLVASGLQRIAGEGGRPIVRQIAVAAAAIALLVYVGVERIGRPIELGLASDVVPFDAIDYVTKNDLRARLYEELDVGCYLLWEGWPRWSVFQDARLPAYPDSFHRALDETPSLQFSSLLETYGVDAALISDAGVNVRAGAFDPEQWALVYRRPDALVFVRRTPAHAAVIARDEIPLRARFQLDGGTHFEPIPSPPPGVARSQCEWTARLALALEADGLPDRAIDARAEHLDCFSDGEAAEVLYRLGARFQIAGDRGRATGYYWRALEKNGSHIAALANLGFALLPSDEESGLHMLERALASDPSRADIRAELAKHGLAR